MRREQVVVDDAAAVEVGRIPERFAEPLDEVRVAVDVAGDQLGRGVDERDLAGVMRRVDERERGIAERLAGRLEPEVGDLLGLEEPLGVASRAMDVADQRREAAEDEHHWQGVILLVLRGDERGEQRAERELSLLRLVEHRVRLVEEERHSATCCRRADALQRHAQAVFQNRRRAGSRAGARRDRHAASEIERDLADRRPRRISDLVLDARNDGELIDRVAQVAGHRDRERVLVAQPRAQVAAHDDPAVALGHPLELLEQHRLANAPQPGDPQVVALLRVVLDEPGEAAQLLVAAGEERRAGADAGLVGVLRQSSATVLIFTAVHKIL